MTTWAAGEIDAGEFKQPVFGCEHGGLGQRPIKFQQLTALSQGLFFRTVGEKAEVADAHKAVGQNVEQEAADKLLGVEGHRLFSVAVFSISIAQSNLAMIDIEDTIIGERHAVGVAAEIVENSLGRTERLFGIDDPTLVMRDFNVAVDSRNFSSLTSLPQ